MNKNDECDCLDFLLDLRHFCAEGENHFCRECYEEVLVELDMENMKHEFVECLGEEKVTVCFSLPVFRLYSISFLTVNFQ